MWAVHVHSAIVLRVPLLIVNVIVVTVSPELDAFLTTHCIVCDPREVPYSPLAVAGNVTVIDDVPIPPELDKLTPDESPDHP